MRQSVLITAAIAAGVLASTASASITITNTSAAAPTYSTTLTFDEAGTPTGSVSTGTWASKGISVLQAGVGGAEVDQVNSQPGFSWLGNGNVFVGSYGVFITFSTPVTAFSCQYWDDSGPSSFFGGGALVAAYPSPFTTGSGADTDLFLDNPAYGGIGKAWFNIVASPGTSISEIDFVGFGDPSPTAYLDNLSWTSVPAPSAAGVLGLAGIGALRRRVRA